MLQVNNHLKDSELMKDHPEEHMLTHLLLNKAVLLAWRICICCMQFYSLTPKSQLNNQS